MSRRESAHTFDINRPPPRRWIEDTLIKRVPRGMLRHRVIQPLFSQPVSELPDEDLAMAILTDGTRHCSKQGVGTAVRAHRIWALLTIAREGDPRIEAEASKLMKEVDTVERFIRSMTQAQAPTSSVAASVFLLIAFTCCRIGNWEIADLCLKELETRRGLSDDLRQDVGYLRSHFPAQAA